MAGTGMSRAALDAFLEQPWIARLGCLDETGAPYVVPTWYEWDGGLSGRCPGPARPGPHFAAGPRVCLCIDEEGGPTGGPRCGGWPRWWSGPTWAGKWVAVAERLAARYSTVQGGHSTWCRRSTARGG